MDKMNTTPGPSGRSGIADDPNNYADELGIAVLLAAINDNSDARNINGLVAQLWTTILQKGLTAEIKENFLSQYRVPENCRYLRAPTLNPEVGNVLGDDSRHLDRIMQTKQDQLGLGIAAIGSAITLMMDNRDLFDEVNDNGHRSSTMTKILEHISNSGRILTDLHHMETNTRRYLFDDDLKNSTSFENLDLRHLVRDQTIYGNSLSRIVRRHENSEARLSEEFFSRLDSSEFARSIYGIPGGSFGLGRGGSSSFGLGRGGSSSFGLGRGGLRRNVARKRRGGGGASNHFPFDM